MNRKISDRFLFLCKESYTNKMTPLSAMRTNNEHYKELGSIAQNYFENNKYNEFAEFLQEGSYLVSLWTAHLLLEYGTLNKRLIFQALQKIVEHLDNPLVPNVGKEEKMWIKENIGLETDC